MRRGRASAYRGSGYSNATSQNLTPAAVIAAIGSTRRPATVDDGSHSIDAGKFSRIIVSTECRFARAST